MNSQSLQRAYRKVTKTFDQEKAILLTFIVWSMFTLVETFTFRSSSAARFPRLTGSAVLIGSLLLLFRNYLPGPIRTIVSESVEVLQSDEDAMEKQKEYEEERKASMSVNEMRSEVSTVGRPIHDSVFSALLMIAYAIVGYAAGIFWATPFFIFAYGIWFKLDRRRILLLTIVGLLIAYGFMAALGIPLDRGEFIFRSGVF